MKLFRKVIAIVLTAAIGLCMASCGDSDSSASSQKKSGYEKTGKFVIALYPEYAPISCENFEKLVNDGFYDGTLFHRIVEGFMAQGGVGVDGKTSDTIKGEFSGNGVKNDLSFKRGIVGVSRGEGNDSGSSSFFICFADKSASLDGRYAAFGEVVEGMDVVDEFLKCERTANSMGELASPVYPITIDKAVMLETKDGEPHKAEFTVTYSPRGA
ncbi:peptidylprolyl isomerase [Ruminococcus sp. NK3A76]|uniref:peptidylprolyl isomerase n=1 Tax=Ruminococcus sp. NK3A76 TaxID=877411 RepID=UPI00055AB01F|nr:peptidylprolyl isomerase [Ruminococcus sp. NK3A76]